MTLDEADSIPLVEQLPSAMKFVSGKITAIVDPAAFRRPPGMLQRR